MLRHACLQIGHVSDLALPNKSLLPLWTQSSANCATPSYYGFRHPVYHMSFFTHLTQMKLHSVQRCVSKGSWAVPGALHFEPFTQWLSFSQACHLVQNSSDLNITTKSLARSSGVYQSKHCKAASAVRPWENGSHKSFYSLPGQKATYKCWYNFFSCLSYACVYSCLKVNHDTRNK